MKDESLADVAPAAAGRQVVEGQEEDDHEGHAGRGVDGTDEEHHDGAARDAQRTGVPGEVSEGGPGEGREKGS